VHFKEVTRFGSYDGDGSSQRMSDVEVQLRDIRGPRRGGDLPIDRVPRFEDDPLAGMDSGDRRDVRMPAVVADLGLVGESLRAIDPDS